jgi:hypothetical protein
MLESDLTSSIPGNEDGLTETLLPTHLFAAQSLRSPRPCGHPDGLTCRVGFLQCSLRLREGNTHEVGSCQGVKPLDSHLLLLAARRDGTDPL